jgi:predicted ATPase
LKEKLIIRNFGPIKDVELELGKFNVLIGENATGKSTVAKLLIAIGNTSYRELFDLKNDENFDEITNRFFGHLKLVGIYNYLYANTEIFFSSSKCVFTYLNKSAKVNLIAADYTTSLLYDFTYIPSERSLAILLLDSLYALIETKASLPQLFLRFGNKFQTSRISSNQFDYSNIIQVNYSYKDSQDIVILSNGKEISIHEASSGIQGSIALLTVFDYVSKQETSINNLIVIEEPEINCFPKTQFELVKHFVFTNKSDQIKGYKNQLLITTHSPYILTSLNNLMYAYQVGQNHQKDVSKVIDQKYWINPKDVSAYQLLTDGTAKNIIDEELKQIDAGKLDEISRSINEEWDKISDIKFSAINEH